jgi:hypothetical protein
VPESAIPTREQILLNATVRQMTNGAEYVWTRCWNCGGTGRYPSSMTPPGQCRLYCWQNRTKETFGKLATPVDVYVKRAQACARAEYRARVRFELERPEREAAEAAAKIKAEEDAYRYEWLKAEEEAWEMNRAMTSSFVGEIGKRVELTVRCVGVQKISEGGYGTFGPRYLLRMRDESGNVLTQWTGCPNLGVGDTVQIRATVKEHSEYRGEKQTVVQRVKATPVAERANAI